MDILQFENVSKSFSGTDALKDVNFNIPAQSIFGLLGPNGAGKTTLIRIITSILAADSGNISFLGAPLNPSHRMLMGYMPEERGLYKKMMVGEQLLYLTQLKGLSKSDAKRIIHEWMEKFDIADWWTKKVEDLSKGMQQKVQFIATVASRPKLLILDEPFSGLDPVNTNLIKNEITELSNQGTSVIFSTHRMEQVEELCRDITLINKGKNILEGGVFAIKEQFKENKYRLVFSGDLNIEELYGVEVLEHSDGQLVVKLNGNYSSNELLKTLIDHNCMIRSFEEVLPTINEIFIKQVKSGSNA